MATFLHPGLVYGPVHSRRLGTSLGVNLLPADGKVCSFDCLYCECGLNAERRTATPLPTAAEVAHALEQKLTVLGEQGVRVDSITLAGNGEPTVNPQFAKAIDAILALRDRLAQEAKVSVLTNATQVIRPDVRHALERVDDCIAKLDTVSPSYISLLDRPYAGYDVDRVIDALAGMDGHVSVQTMFLRGSWEGHDVSNTDERYVGPWLEALARIAPAAVTIYTIDRETPVPTLEKAAPEELDAIAKRVRLLGVACSVSY